MKNLLKRIYIRFLESCKPAYGFNHATLRINWWDQMAGDIHDRAQAKAKKLKKELKK